MSGSTVAKQVEDLEQALRTEELRHEVTRGKLADEKLESDKGHTQLMKFVESERQFRIRVKQLESNLINRNQVIFEQDQERERLQGQRNEAQGQRNEAQAIARSTRVQTLGEVQGQFDELNGKLRRKNEIIEHQAAELEGLRRKLSPANRMYPTAEAEKAITELVNDKGILVEQVNERDTTIDALQTRIGSLEAERDALGSNIADLESERQPYQSSAVTKKRVARIADLERLLAASERRVEAYRDEEHLITVSSRYLNHLEDKALKPILIAPSGLAKAGD